MEKWYNLGMEIVLQTEIMERQENVVGFVSPASLFPASLNHWLIGPYKPSSLWRIGWEAIPAFPQSTKEEVLL